MCFQQSAIIYYRVECQSRNVDSKDYNSPDAVGLQGHGVEDEGLGEGRLGGPQPRPEVVQVEQVHGRLRVAHLRYTQDVL